MAKRIYDKFTVWKNDDIRKYLSEEQICQLLTITSTIQSGRTKDGKAAGHNYYVVNSDEPYSDEILQLILKGEDTKNGIVSNERALIKMIDYDGEPVPEELCTVGRDGAADDFVGCGACFECEGHLECSECVIDRLFKEYARLTNQLSTDAD
jgi:hypothetical protein